MKFQVFLVTLFSIFLIANSSQRLLSTTKSDNIAPPKSQPGSVVILNQNSVPQTPQQTPEEAKKKAEEARKKAEEEAKKKAEEARKKAEEEAKKKAEEARKKAEEEAKKKAEEDRKKAEEEAKKKAEEARKKAEEEAKKKAQELEKRLAQLVSDIEDLRNKTTSVKRILDQKNSISAIGEWPESNTLEEKMTNALFPKKFFYLILQNLTGKVIQKFAKFERLILKNSKSAIPKNQIEKSASNINNSTTNQMEAFLSLLNSADILLRDSQMTLINIAENGFNNKTKVVVDNRIDTKFLGFLVGAQLNIDNLNQNMGVLHKLVRLINGKPTIAAISKVFDILDLNFDFKGTENIKIIGFGNPENKFNKLDSLDSNIAKDNSAPVVLNSTFSFKVLAKN